MNSVIDHVDDYYNATRFQKTIFALMATMLAPKEEIASLKKKF